MEKSSIVELFFQFERIDNHSMALRINNELVEPNEQGMAQMSLAVNFPSVLELKVSGKSMNKDTVLDSAGNIVADKHIKLIRATVDRLPVPDRYLERWPELNGNKTNYFGFNGIIKLNFDATDSFKWMLKCMT